MSTSLHLLILEDQPAEAERMVLHLDRAGFVPHWQRVETEQAFTARLGSELELILANYQLPHYDALRALDRARESAWEGPFIIISGRIGEERAVAAMQQGAADIVIKDRLERLGPSVTRVLEQRRLRQAQLRAQDSLRRFAELSQRIVAAAKELAEVTPHYERLATLTFVHAAAPETAAAMEAADAPVRNYLESKLHELLQAFSQVATNHADPFEAARDAERTSKLLAGLKDSIIVLEQTKRSFKSRSLGQLRERMEALLSAQRKGD